MVSGAIVRWPYPPGYFPFIAGADRFANAMRAYGLEKGDRVATLVENSSEAVIAQFGAVRLGAVKRDKLLDGSRVAPGQILLGAWQLRRLAETAAVVGEKGVVDLIGVTGYYQLVSMLLNVDRYPLPAGVQAELKPLR